MKQCRQYLAQFDIDCSGFIEEEELITLLQNFAEELNAQLRELSGHLIIACPAPAATSGGGSGSGPKTYLAGNDDASGAPPPIAAIALSADVQVASATSTKTKASPPLAVIRYIPPAKGTLSMTVVDSLLAKVGHNS